MFEYLKMDPYYRLIYLCVKEYPSNDELDRIKYLFNKLNEKQFLLIAIEHEVEGICYTNIVKAGIKPHSLHFYRSYKDTSEKIKFYLNEIEKIAKSIGKDNNEIILLKNAGIAAVYSDDLGKCPMGDIDLLVKQNEFINIHNNIIRSGFILKFRNPNEKATIKYITETGNSEYFKDLNIGRMWLEMSVRSVSGRWIRPDQEPRNEVLFKTAIKYKENIKILCPEYNLLQVCLHTAKHSFMRAPGFRLHLDVERIVKNSNIDWSKFVKIVNEYNVKTPVYFSLIIPMELFSTPIPLFVMNALRPNIIREKYIYSVLKRVDIMHPHKKKFSKIKFAIFHIMLYESFQEIFKALFPSVDYVQEMYSIKTLTGLVKYYIRRIRDIVFRRSSI